jgi:hypothetical protein
MAKDSLAPRSRAANVSRRALLGGIAITPLTAAVRIIPNSSAWERALKAYSAAHYRYEAFLGMSLQPAYARYKADLANLGLREFDDAPDNGPFPRDRITETERQIVEAGGGRTEIVRLRTANPEHAEMRSALAADLRLRRERARLMRRHKVFELEEEGNDLLATKSDALRELLIIPAVDRADLLLKVRLGYEDIFRHEDHDALLGAIFADVERHIGDAT